MFRRILVCVALLFAPFGAFAQVPNAPKSTSKDYVVICPISGVIDDGITVFVKRAIREARTAKAIVFVVDTPGGRIDSAIAISNAILGAPCETVAFVKGMGAISAGALISLSCNTIIMEPGSAIGAATPIILGPEGPQPTSEKEVSFMRAKMRSLAQRNGHNSDIAQAMVDKDVGLRAEMENGKLVVRAANTALERAPAPQGGAEGTLDTLVRLFKNATGGERSKPKASSTPPPAASAAREANGSDSGKIVLPVGKLLTLTPSEAEKYGLIPTTAENLNQALGYLGLASARRVMLEMSWNERLFRFLINPMVSGILLMLGLGGIYLEMKAPGHSFPGIIGVICLALFFGSYGLIGLADWFDVILVVLGIALILIEIFLVPGVTLVGGAGLICVLLGLYLALTGKLVPQFSWDYQRLWNAGESALVATVTLTLLVYFSWKYLPKSPLFQGLFMNYTQGHAKGYVVQTQADREAAVGRVGVATSKLRPAGRGRFGDTTFDVVSNSEYIEPGTAIVIVQVDGNRYVVDKAKGTK